MFKSRDELLSAWKSMVEKGEKEGVNFGIIKNRWGWEMQIKESRGSGRVNKEKEKGRRGSTWTAEFMGHSCMVFVGIIINREVVANAWMERSLTFLYLFLYLFLLSFSLTHPHALRFSCSLTSPSPSSLFFSFNYCSSSYFRSVPTQL